MRNIWKKTLTLLLALCLVAGLLPLGALADTAISVSTAEELLNALKIAKKKITLTATITVIPTTNMPKKFKSPSKRSGKKSYEFTASRIMIKVKIPRKTKKKIFQTRKNTVGFFSRLISYTQRYFPSGQRTILRDGG